MGRGDGRRHTVTIKDLARETGLSVATISVVLTKAPKSRRIPAETQQRIHEAAKKLGYYPNLLARSLRSKRTHNIGMLIFDITDPYCTLIVRGMENVLYESGYMPVLTDLQNNSKRLRQCLQMLMERQVEGVIAIGNPLYLETNLLGILSQLRIPAVVIGRKLKQSGFASVVIDNEAGTRAALEHLYELGHREVAFIRGPRALNDSLPRWKGLCDFAKQVHLRIDPKLVLEIRGQNSSYEEGYRLTQLLLQSKLHFTALVAFDDLTAFAAIGALTSAGLKVPEDCSVVGFDDVPGAAFYNPPLTTVHQYLETQGAIGAEMIKALVDDLTESPIESVHRKVAPKLVVRKSTAAVPSR